MFTSHWQSLMRRHSLHGASPLDPYPVQRKEESDRAILGGIVQDLRVLCSSLPSDPSSRPDEMREIPPPTTQSVTTMLRHEMLEELERRIHMVGPTISNVDAQLAKHLSALLGCIDRLLVLARDPDPSKGESEINPQGLENGSSGIYETLRRDALALQIARAQSLAKEDELLSTVEEAERNLLWGRIDDLLSNVGGLCQSRLRTSEDVGRMSSGVSEWRLSNSSFLPSYSGRQQRDSLLPPGYDEHAPEYDPDSKSVQVDEKALFNSEEPLTATRTPSSLDEKMQADFENVAMAIERLYLSSPQLANQRVELDKRKTREAQLTTLGNAIERLSRGRLEDQRATLVVKPLSKAADSAQSDGRDESLDELIASIDRATSRSLSNQRATLRRVPTVDPLQGKDQLTLPWYSPRQARVLQDARRTARAAMVSGLHLIARPLPAC